MTRARGLRWSHTQLQPGRASRKRRRASRMYSPKMYTAAEEKRGLGAGAHRYCHAQRTGLRVRSPRGARDRAAAWRQGRNTRQQGAVPQRHPNARGAARQPGQTSQGKPGAPPDAASERTCGGARRGVMAKLYRIVSISSRAAAVAVHCRFCCVRRRPAYARQRERWAVYVVTICRAQCARQCT